MIRNISFGMNVLEMAYKPSNSHTFYTLFYTFRFIFTQTTLFRTCKIKSPLKKQNYRINGTLTLVMHMRGRS